MNKTISFLSLILCVGLLIGAAANVLAQTSGGKTLRQSDINGLVEVYEWAFEGKFTTAQRARFQRQTEADFRRDPATTRRSIDSMIENFAKIKASDEDTQRKLRERFAPSLVEDLRRQTDNDGAQALLEVYDAAHNDGANDKVLATADSNNDDSTASVGDISAIVGKWVWGRSGSSTYSTGGALMGSNGSRFTYQFFPNGKVQFTGIMNVMSGSCSQQVFQSREGKASLSGDTLTIDWAPEKFTRDFSCDTAHNYTKTMPAKTEKLQISMKTDLGQKQLCFVGAECFSPTK